MSQEIVKFDVNNVLTSANLNDVKEEFQDEYDADNKVCVSETTITDNINISMYVKNDEIMKYEKLSVHHIKPESPSSEVNGTVSNDVNVEDGICAADTQIEFCNELPFCNHCHEVYQDYCTKCGVLIHILNKRHSRTACNRIRELPKYVLEARESMGHLGIFSLKVIPENVRFGPFTGLNSTEPTLRIKGGRFVVSHDKLERLNWMQYVNPAGNIYEQNLFPFQYEDKLYYNSTRRIQEGEELLVYFGAEYEDNLLKNMEMDFVPIVKKNVENVFACTFCCLGFSLKEYLAEHKVVSHSGTNEIFSIQELTQCPFCKIYLDAKEYLEQHKDYCREANIGNCLLNTPVVHEVEIERCSFLRSKAKRWKRGIYKCTQCKFTTMYNTDFRHHSNQHYEIKMYKCGICYRKYKTKGSLKTHLVKMHGDNEGKNVQNYLMCANFKVNITNIKAISLHSHDGEKQCQSSKCNFHTIDKCHLKSYMSIKHLNRGKYKCVNCEFKTYYRTYLERHVKIKHLSQDTECDYQTNSKSYLKTKRLKLSDYKCMECEYEANFKSNLKQHIRTKHLLNQDNYKCKECEFTTKYKSNLEKHMKVKHIKENNYKCKECGYKTIYKSSLEKHVKAKHLKEKEYNCTNCEYKTNFKSSLQVHIKTKHLKLSDYKCMQCEYQTNFKSNLKLHIKTKHLLLNDYKCIECEYQTNFKSHLQVHIKRKHLKENEYKCMECEYQTKFKLNLELHIKTKHLLNQKDYKCTECEFKTNYKSNLEAHIKVKHLKENDYKCMECEFRTFYKSNLDKHIKAKHLKEKDYKCSECEFKTNYKSYLELHIKTKHLKLSDYKCMECEYQTNFKSNLELHIKTKHLLNQKDYKCGECEFRTNYKSNLDKHVKVKHLKENNYKCIKCEFKTNYKSSLEAHIKTKHLKQKDYKCTECEFKTNYTSHLKSHVKRKHFKLTDAVIGNT